jgi:hypothetical protein
MSIMVDPETGERYVMGEDGVPIPEGGGVSGALEAALVQAGGGIESLYRGGEGLYNALTGTPEEQSVIKQQLQSEAEEQQRVLAPIGAEYPKASFIGRALPGLSTAPLSGGLLTQAMINAGMGAAEYNPDKSPIEQAAWGAAGTVAGYPVGIVASNIVSKIAELGGDVANKVSSRAAQKVLDVGGQVTKGQRMGSPVVRQVEVGLARNPATSEQFFDINRHNQELVNGRAAEAIGLTPDALPNGRIEPGVLAQASDAIGARINASTKGVGEIDMGKKFGEVNSKLPQFKALKDRGYFSGLDDGIVRGEEYAVLRQALVEESQNAAGKGNHTLQKAIYDDVEALDDAAQAFLTPAQMKEFALGREQWRNLKVLEGVNILKDGNVSASNAASAFARNYDRTFKEGRNDRVNANTAKFFDTIKALSSPDVKPIVGDSGTQTAAASQSLLKDFAGVMQGSPGAARSLAQTYGTNAIYNLPDATLDTLLRSGSPLAAGVSGKVGSQFAKE